MKRATLTRGPSTDEGTFGVLQIDGQTLRSVELPWQDNRPKVSCIPPGIYRCEITQSPRFGRVYQVRDVPGRSHILIHAANFGGCSAKGYECDLEGCIAPALSVGKLDGQTAGIASGAALSELMAWAGGQPFELEIT